MTASRAPASQATSSRIAGRHHLGISGRLRRNLQEGATARIASRFDATAAYLFDHGLVLSQGEGKLYITCPWKHEHTGDSGETETAYLLDGTDGRGHFKCLHAHCEGRTDDEFRDALGYGTSNDFEALAPSEPTARPTLPALSRRKSGAIEAKIKNLTAVLDRPDVCGWRIGFDTFRDEITYFPTGEPGQWRALGDADYVRLREHLEQNGFDPIGRELMRDAVLRVADITRSTAPRNGSKPLYGMVNRALRSSCTNISPHRIAAIPKAFRNIFGRH
jgi:hypothetical protein